MASLAFYVAVALQVLSFAVATRHGDPAWRRVARTLVVVGLVPQLWILGAPIVAMTCLVASLVIFVGDGTRTVDEAPRDEALARGSIGISTPCVVGFVPWLLLVFVLVGTLARQVVTYGESVRHRPRFGADVHVLKSVFETWPAFVLMSLLALLAVAGRHFATLSETGQEEEGS